MSKKPKKFPPCDVCKKPDVGRIVMGKKRYCGSCWDADYGEKKTSDR